MAFDWGTAATGLIGAIFGGAATLLGARMQLKSNAREQRRREDDHRQAILQALHDEIETISEVYQRNVGNQISLLQQNQPFLFLWPVSLDYFSVYHSNAVFIGHLKDNDLRKSIVQTYTYAKSAIDSYKLNNHFVERHQQAVFMAAQASTPANQQTAQALFKQLVQYAPVLGDSHTRLVTSTADTLRRLRKAGVLHEH
jgi:hypothetical protein